MARLALNCRLQVEQFSVKESAGGPLVLALRCLCFLGSCTVTQKDKMHEILDLEVRFCEQKQKSNDL